jgi:hypothetical protein
MKQLNAIKQMIQFNKNAFDKGYNTMEMLRAQNERITDSILGQAYWMPEEGKKAVNEWMQLHKKGCDDFKKTVDQTYKDAEKILAGSEK